MAKVGPTAIVDLPLSINAKRELQYRASVRGSHTRCEYRTRHTARGETAQRSSRADLRLNAARAALLSVETHS